MGKTRPPYAPEFRQEAVRLFHTGDKSRSQLAAELGVSAPTLGNWIRQEEIDSGRASGLTTTEREELKELRKENKILREERAILKKAAAFFAREGIRR